MGLGQLEYAEGGDQHGLLIQLSQGPPLDNPPELAPAPRSTSAGR
jgi:hypothetical protein